MPPTRRVGPYAKLTATYAADDALMEAGEAAELLFVRGLAFCSTSDSDGFITDGQLMRYVGAGMRDAKKRADRLVGLELWERGVGGYQIRSWLKYHESSDEKGIARRRDRDRKAAERTSPPDVQLESERSPSGQTPDNVAESIDVSLSLIQDRTEQDRTSLPEASPSGRKRDELWDALAAACEMDPNGVTQSARGSMNTALKQLREVSATAGAIKVRARRFREQYPGITLTPTALAKHWPQLDSSAQSDHADPLRFAR